MSKYAVNLTSLMKLQETDPIGALLFPLSILGEVVEPNKRRFGHTAITLLVDEARGAAIVQLIREKYRKYEFLLYRSETGKGGWRGYGS